jgi:hypothetical protein
MGHKTTGKKIENGFIFIAFLVFLVALLYMLGVFAGHTANTATQLIPLLAKK